MSGAAAEKSNATAVKVSTTNDSVQTDLTWPNGAGRFIKVSDIQKAQKQATKAARSSADICCITDLLRFSEFT